MNYFNENLINKEIEKTMSYVKEIISTILSLRKKCKIKVRQPLSKVIFSPSNYSSIFLKYKDIILSETNIKQLEINDVEKYEIKDDFKGVSVAIDIKITDELMLEGLARTFIKNIQNYRKKNNFNIDDKIVIYISTDDDDVKKSIENYKNIISKELLCDKIIFVDNITTDDFIHFDNYYFKIEKI